ncbi:TIGR04540 family protein [Wukongibacter sp. M2B1]|uniref:TIGR04540 family protein n=1 Tax=Wukongibacter sp. M2B1 TaxID=3088895 RepID=UPI003D79BC47
MELKLFYKTQSQVAQMINQVIDAYLDDKIEEKDMIEKLNMLVENNHSKVFKNKDYTSVLKQKCGQRRIEILSKILEMSGKE